MTVENLRKIATLNQNIELQQRYSFHFKNEDRYSEPTVSTN